MRRRRFLGWLARITGGWLAFGLAPSVPVLARVNTTRLGGPAPQSCGQDVCTTQDGCTTGDTPSVCTTQDVCDYDTSGDCTGDRCEVDSSGTCTDDGGPACSDDGTNACPTDRSGGCVSDKSAGCEADGCVSDKSGECAADGCISDASLGCAGDRCVADSSGACTNDGGPACSTDDTNTCLGDASGVCISDSSGGCSADACKADHSGACETDACGSDSSSSCHADGCVSDSSEVCISDECIADRSGECESDGCVSDDSGGCTADACESDSGAFCPIDRCVSDSSGPCSTADVCVADASGACGSDLCRDDQSVAECAASDTCALDLAGALDPTAPRVTRTTLNRALRWLYRVAGIVGAVALVAASAGEGRAATAIDATDAVFAPAATFVTGQPVTVTSPVGPFLRDCDGDAVLEADTNGDGSCWNDPELRDDDGDGTRAWPAGTPFSGSFRFTCFHVPDDVAIVATGALDVKASEEVAVFGAVRLASGASIASSKALDGRTSAWLSESGAAITLTTAAAGEILEAPAVPGDGREPVVPAITFTSRCDVALDPPAPPAMQRLCGPVALTGTGITPGSVLKAFVATAQGPKDVVAAGIAPSATTFTTWSGQLPCPWEAPHGYLLGQGFVGLMLVQTDLGYRASNVVGIPLIGDPAHGAPSVLAVGGTAISATSWQPSIGLANVERVLANDGATTYRLDGEGFDTPLVNVFSASGNCGPLTPDAWTASTVDLRIPPSCPTGPGSLQVINATGAYRASNAVSAPLGAAVGMTSVGIAGSTITVTGAGFSSLTVINFFATGNVSGQVENFGGLGPGGVAVIPLALAGATQFSFTRPAGAAAGAAFVEAINPPFIPFASSGSDPDGAFTLP